MELAFLSPDLRNVDMEKANGIGFEFGAVLAKKKELG